MIRPSLLCAALALAVLPAASLLAQEVAWQSVAALQQRMDAGTLSSKTLVRDDIARIKQIDQAGPTLRAVL
jgi:amidase